MRFFVTKISFVFILISLLAGCKSSPESEIIGFWKSTTAQPEVIVEIGSDYFSAYYAPEMMVWARKEGKPVKVFFEQIGDELQGLEVTLNTPAIRVKDVNGDNAHIQISTLKNNFIRISEGEAKSTIDSWPNEIPLEGQRALP